MILKIQRLSEFLFTEPLNILIVISTLRNVSIVGFTCLFNTSISSPYMQSNNNLFYTKIKRPDP